MARDVDVRRAHLVARARFDSASGHASAAISLQRRTLVETAHGVAEQAPMWVSASIGTGNRKTMDSSLDM